MHLIGPLVSGVAGAGNGTAEIYIRGTTSRATYYTDFEGDEPVTTGASVVLDSNGGAEVYVNQLVTVVVKDSGGVTVRNFVAGVASPNVEVISGSFTGTDYTSGATGTSYPTTLQAVLDKWNDSSGAPDWKVSVNGSDVNIESAIASLGGAMFNVKDMTYGATGDGTTDDTVAIAACLTAAQAAGQSLVVFPAGTYKTNGALSVGSKVSILGFGATIRNTHATASTLAYASASAVYRQSIKGIAFSTTSSTGNHIEVAGAGSLSIVDCQFAQGTLAMNPVRVANSSADVSITGCKFTLSLASGNMVYATSAKRLHITDSTFVYSAATSAGAAVMIPAGATSVDTVISGCYFDLSASTAAGYNVLELDADNGAILVAGNRWTNRGGTVGTVNAIYCVPLTESSALRLTEVGNVFGTDGDSSAPLAYGTMPARAKLLTRNGRPTAVTDAGSATLALDADQFGVIVVRQTSSGAAQTLNLDATNAIASELMVVYHNDSAGVTGTITWGTGVRSSATTFTVNANSVSIFYFKRVTFNSTNYWAICGTSPANLAE